MHSSSYSSYQSHRNCKTTEDNTFPQYSNSLNQIKKQLQEYRMKYNLIKESLQDQSSLNRSRRQSELELLSKKISQNEEKWKNRVKNVQEKYQGLLQKQDQEISLLRTQNQNSYNNELSRRKDQNLEERIQRALKGNYYQAEQMNSPDKLPHSGRKDSVQSPSQPLQQPQLNRDSPKQSLISFSKRDQSSYRVLMSPQPQSNQPNRSNPHPTHNQQQLIAKVKKQEKQFYRQQISLLQQQVQAQKQTIQELQEKVSPLRQGKISQLKQKQLQLAVKYETQIRNILERHQQREIQMNQVIERLSKEKTVLKGEVKQLTQQLENLRTVLAEERQGHIEELRVCRMDYQHKRLQQLQQIKQNHVLKLQQQFERERDQWKSIMKTQEDELSRVKEMWQGDKEKYLEEKEKLKQKISQLKERQKSTQEQERQKQADETNKVLNSLRELDEYEDKYNTYENGITFLHHQLKKSAMRLHEKSDEVENLLKELQELRKTYQGQLTQQKGHFSQIIKKQNLALMEKDEKINQLYEQVREKTSLLMKKQRQCYEQLKKKDLEVASLKDMVKEMQNDYNYLTRNNKDLYKSYRSERDNVFTGKMEINQERKLKYQQLARQKNQLQIAYKQKQQQLREQFEAQIYQLTEQNQKLRRQNTLSKEEMSILKEKSVNQLNQNETEQRSSRMLEFSKKLNTLDLEINLLETLSKDTLRKVHNQNKTKAKSENENQSQDGNQSRNQNQHQLQHQQSKKRGNIDSFYFQSQQSSRDLGLDKYHNKSQQRDDRSIETQRKIRELENKELTEDQFVGQSFPPTFAGNQTKTRVLKFPEANMQMSFHPAEESD